MGKAEGASPGRNPASWGISARKASQARGISLLQRGDLGEVAFVHKAMSLGFVVAKPYGQIHRYDFIVEGGSRLWRVQVKTCSRIRNGLYQVSVHCHKNSVAVAYTESEVDFVVAYIIPEETWYVMPVCEVVRRTAFLFRPKGFPRRDLYSHYREAWHLLRQPDGLTF
jgi:hypothetical protein